MGYRSEVEYICYADDKDKEAVGKLKLFVDSCVFASKYIVMDRFEESGYFGFEFEANDVKWYPEYEDVKEFETFMESLDQMLCDQKGFAVHWEFVRLGEDDTDIEYRVSSEAHGILRVTREIERYY